MKCSDVYNSVKVQAVLKKSFQKWANKMIQEQGGLQPNSWLDFKKGFRQAVMKTCKAKKSKNRTLKK